jgi:hypothetical protein
MQLKPLFNQPVHHGKLKFKEQRTGWGKFHFKLLSRNTNKMQLCNNLLFQSLLKAQLFQVAHRSKHAEPSINFGIINSVTKLHLVGISTE